MLSVTLLANLDIDIDKTIGIQFITFAITMLGLYFLFGKEYLEVRHRRIAGTKGSELEAANFEERAEAVLLEYETLLKQAKQDASEVRDALATQGKEKSEALVAGAESEVEKQLSGQREQLQKSVDKARSDIRSRAEELSNVLVRKVLQ